jgi:hypothetical protein
MNAQPTPRFALAHPVSLGAIGLLLLNDHVLKEIWPGAVTGKLSDFAGLVFFPLLVVTAVGMATGHRWSATVPALAVVATGVGFVLIQTWDPAADIYRHTLGYLQWPFRYLLHGAASPIPVDHTADPTDLFALPALLVAWKLSRHRTEASRGDPELVAGPPDYENVNLVG